MKIDLNTYSVESKDQIKVDGVFINRELSWISFDHRVLYYAANRNVPINERFNFLGISDNNLNEFIAVRFSYAYHNKKIEPYREILKEIKKLKRRQATVFDALRKSIEKDYKFTRVKSLTQKERAKVYDWYKENVFPLLTPINLSRDGIYEAILTAQLCIGVMIRTHEGRFQINVIPIPNSLNGLYYIGKKILLIEDIIQEFLGETIFINKKIDKTCSFKLIRDCDISIDHSSTKFMIDKMQDVITRRNQSHPIFVQITQPKSDDEDDMILSLCGIFDINENHVYASNDETIDYCRFMKPVVSGKNTSYEPFKSVEYANVANYDSLLDALRDGNDILLHHPYDSFNTVVKFIEHAAVDPNVLDIKQTLYRVSSNDSPIVNALCKAAENGKRVTVLIEVKARFDEMNNIRLVDKLRNSGVYVLLSFENLKTHAKMCIIIRREDDKLRIYSHVATGNYNEKTAELYTDLSYLTSKRKIGEDLIYIFNILSGNSVPDNKLQKISYAPINLRTAIEDKIEKEIQAAKKGKQAEIFMKLNSLSDKRMVNKLYNAAKKGVKIYILCRGVCSIVPRKNIYVKSIVGRFLEHSRIYYFKNSDVCISSADLLTRNLDKRVEILISLKDSNVVKQVKWIIDVLKRDRKNSFVMQPNGNYVHMDGAFDAHQWFIEHTDTMKRKKKWKH